MLVHKLLWRAKMQIPLCPGVLIACLAYAGPIYAQSGTGGTVLPDTSLFSAVVHQLASRAPVAEPIRVDPRALRHEVPALPASSVFTRAGAESMTLDSTALSQLVPVDLIAPTTTSLAKESAKVIRRRREVLRQLGIQETDALADALCPGGLIFPTTDPEMERRRAASCPKGKQFTSVILSQPRPGGAYWPGFIDERAPGRAKGQWTVRATQRTMTAGGSSAAVYDYVAEPAPSGQGWRIVKAVQLLITD